MRAVASVSHPTACAPPAVQAAAEAAPAGEARQRWRRRLHHYLDWLFQRHSQQGAAFAELQVGHHICLNSNRVRGLCGSRSAACPAVVLRLPCCCDAFALPLHVGSEPFQQRAFALLISAQVELYAEFEPARLLHFLMVSPHYPLDRAYQVSGSSAGPTVWGSCAPHAVGAAVCVCCFCPWCLLGCAQRPARQA